MGGAMTCARPTRLLTQNRRLKQIGVWNWTLPAFAGRMADGRTYNTCPSAGICRDLCYARVGTYRFPAVKAKHEANLAFVLDDLAGWQQAMLAELAAPRFTGAWVRIHDSGDFFSEEYLAAWLRICRARPETQFYCYTKEIRRFRTLVEPDPPPNLRWTFSYGGTQDHLIDPTRDRVSDVFPDAETIAAAGFASQETSDLTAVTGPRQIGIPANRIPHLVARQGRARFSELQAIDDGRQARRRSSSGAERWAA
jgi:hypothetical protein